MKQVGNILLVKVPKGANGFELWKEYHIKGVYKNPGVGYNHPDPEINWEETELPPGRWQLLRSCTADQLTEEDWRKIVDWYGVGDGSIDEAGVGDTFFCYDDTEFCYDTAVESGLSLIRSQGMEPEETVVLYNPIIKRYDTIKI
jgi:hypothetical protein